jgi:DNA-directed RNA polymerase specialized sigma24 family protein
VVRISDISGEVLAADSGARVLVTFLDGRAAVEMDVSDREAEELITKRSVSARLTRSSIEEIRRRHPRAYAPWTPEEEAELRDLHERGLKPKAIAGELGRQVGGVRSRLRKLGPITSAG